ncbi:MAG: hypothetical protein U0T36_04655 [Saprospiraceae bacterium]
MSITLITAIFLIRVMGEQKVSLVSDQKQMQKFVKSLLNDVSALEYMLDNEWV